MEIRNLQLGDWVEVYDGDDMAVQQVDDLNEIIMTDRAGDMWHEGNIEPILLTREMLEDNLFVHADVDKDGLDVYRRGTIAVTVRADGYAVAVTISGEDTASLTRPRDVVKVHELQHLMVMMGYTQRISLNR